MILAGFELPFEVENGRGPFCEYNPLPKYIVFRSICVTIQP